MASEPPPPERIREAVAVLRAGGLLAFPTETVYGLGADADSPLAVRSIFRAKGRPTDHPVIVHVASVQALAAWCARVPPEAMRLAQTFWPGPLTLILPRSARAHDGLTGAQPSVGLRCPSHAWARALLFAWCDANRDPASAIAAPSANRYGRISPTRAEHVLADLGQKPQGVVDLVLDGGPCDLGIESTIVDCTGPQPRILRPGSIRIDDIEHCLGRHLVAVPIGDRSAPRASGRLLAHYAPRKPLVLLTRTQLLSEAGKTSVGLLYASAADISAAPALPGWKTKVASSDPEIYARELYETLHEFDQGAEPVLYVVIPADGPRWVAVRDRLERAAAGSHASAETQFHHQQREG